MSRIEFSINGNKVSGTWKPDKIESASDTATTFTFKVIDGGLSMTDLTGASRARRRTP